MHGIAQSPKCSICIVSWCRFADVLTPARANLKPQNAINTVFVATHADRIRKRVLKRVNADAASERKRFRREGAQIIEEKYQIPNTK